MSYSKKEIAAGFIREIASKLTAVQLISTEQLAKIITDFKISLYTPSVFVRIGLFIFTMVLINAAIGIIGIAISDLIDNELTIGILLMIAAGGLIGVLEYFIHQKLHYKSGIDDCLLYTAMVFMIGGIVLLTGLYDGLQICLLALPVLLLAAWRYADAFASVLAFICFYSAVFLVLKDYSFGRLWMPFIFLGISGILVFLINFWLNKDSLFYYENSLQFLKVAALLTLYGSMNYFVVKEGNMLLNEGVFGIENVDIPFAGLFLAVTFVVPVTYIIFGLKRKDRLLMWTGLGVLILTLLTLKYKYEYLEYKYLMTGSGVVLLLTSWLTIRYLKNHETRFTYAPDLFESRDRLMNAEALIISQTLGQQNIATPDNAQFGDGSFGGGGAGGNI